MISRRSLFGAALLAACSAGPRAGAPAPAPDGQTGPPPPPPPPVTAPVARPILYQPGTTRYATHDHRVVTQEIMGQQQTQEFGITSYLTVAIAPGPQAGTYQLTITADSVVSDSGLPALPGVDWGQVRGSKVTGTLSANGEVTDIVGPDSTAPPVVRNLGNEVREFLPELPAGGLTPATRWIDTTQRKTPAGGGEIASRAVRTHETGQWMNQNGLLALELRIASTYTLAGTLSQGGQDLNLDGSGSRQTRYVLSTDGRFLGGEVTDSASMTVVIPAAGMSVPVTQVQRTTVKTLP